MSPNAYEVARVTAEAPTIDASNSSKAKMVPSMGVMCEARPRAMPRALSKWPKSLVSMNAAAEAIMIAAAPMTTTNAPMIVSAFS